MATQFQWKSERNGQTNAGRQTDRQTDTEHFIGIYHKVQSHTYKQAFYNLTRSKKALNVTLTCIQ